nr:MAG TPA: hypothetical protein [Caudoviricetes sp.]
MTAKHTHHAMFIIFVIMSILALNFFRENMEKPGGSQ